MNNDEIKINNRHKLFALEYCANGCKATEAYITVYGGTNRTSAGVKASKLLKKANIQAFIQLKLQEIEDERVMKVDEILKRYTAIARNNPEAMYSDNPFRYGIKVEESLQALNQLTKIYGMDRPQEHSSVDIDLIYELDGIELEDDTSLD